MPRFLGLKSYLTTNRSNITKQQAIRERRLRLNKWGVLREEVAGRLKCPLCFGVPCVVGAVVLLVLIGIYVTMPHLRGLNFETSQCTVLKIEFSKKGSCSLRTEQFEPCLKIIVNYKTADDNDVNSVLMENEQTVTHCDKCSYTFGKGGLFEKQGCSLSTPRSCVAVYNEKHGKINSKYSCYYDPDNPQDVFREYKISRSEVVYQTLLPALFILLYLVGFIFVRYDGHKRRKINKQIKLEKHQRHAVGTRRHKSETTTDSKSNSSLTSDSPSSSGSTTTMYRVRKKKMACTKVHVLSSRDEENVIMEEKPISPVNKRQSNVFMEVNVDKLAPSCACANHQSLSNGFELARVRETFRPVIPSQYHHHNQLKQSRRTLRYLPESIV